MCEATVMTPMGPVQCTYEGKSKRHWRHIRWIPLSDNGWIKIEWGRKPL